MRNCGSVPLPCELQSPLLAYQDDYGVEESLID